MRCPPTLFQLPFTDAPHSMPLAAVSHDAPVEPPVSADNVRPTGRFRADAATSATPTVTIFGGPPDSGNLGVNALGTCAVKGVLMAFPGARIILQSWAGTELVDVAIEGHLRSVEGMMIYYSTKLGARHGTRHLGLMGRCLAPWARSLPTPLARLNRTLAQLMDSDVILDASGGDAFAEIYGERVFRVQIAMKRLARQLGKPLILLPQTYGPFTSIEGRAAAREVLANADLVATRENTGIDELVELCGKDITQRTVCTPDMAFMLDPIEVDPSREPAISRGQADRTLVGVNVSGLLYRSDSDFGLKVSYPDLVDGILRAVLSRPETHVVLVPHVVSFAAVKTRTVQPSRDFADEEALVAARRRLPTDDAARVTCLGGPYTAGETKYLIGQCDFFVGARMHACIGAVSQCVPTATIAYSKKASQLMKNLGIGETVIDPRTESLDDCIAQVCRLFELRRDIASKLETILPPVKQSIESFFCETFRNVLTNRHHARHR